MSEQDKAFRKKVWNTIVDARGQRVGFAIESSSEANALREMFAAEALASALIDIFESEVISDE